MKKRIVVFGAAGTLGLYLVDNLAAVLPSDEWEIVASGRSDLRFFDRYSPLVRYVKADITQPATFDALPTDCVYAVVHFAGALPAYMEGYDPRLYIDANMMGTLNVLEYARSVDADRIIYTQTISDYTGYFGEMTELMDDMPRRPAMTGDHAVYAITKVAAEELCRHYHEEYGLGYFAFRLPNIYCYMHDSKTLYQDGEPKASSYRLMIDRAIKGEPLEIWGDPEKGIDLIYVKDFCQMIEKALFADNSASGTYNVGTGVMTSLEQQVRNIADVFCDPSERSEIRYRPEMHDCVNYYMNVEKAKKNLGYSPKYTPVRMLEDYKAEMEADRFADFFAERYERSSS